MALSQYNQDLSNEMTPSDQSPADQKKAERIIARFDAMDSAAINWKTHWQLCYEFIVPRKEDVIASRLPGDLRDEDIYDSTAVLANEQLASALHGMLTNPETQFFDIVFSDPNLMKDEQVQVWCQQVSNILFRLLNNTNFQTEVFETYIDLGAIGTACMYAGDHDDNLVHFSARAMKEIRIDENALGIVDTVGRLFKWRPAQIVSYFGEKNCPQDVLRGLEKQSQDQMEIIHMVEPMSPQDAQNPAGWMFDDTYVLRNSRFILKKGGLRRGYHNFPYMVPRWSKTAGEIYGRGPGMHMLPEIMMVNAMRLSVIQGAQKTVDPPLMVEDDGVIGIVRLTPGGLTVVRPGESDKIKPLITNAQVEFGETALDKCREIIRQGFYVDQLSLPSGPQKTAEEIQQRTEDRLRLMGPVMGRQHSEFLCPLIQILFGKAWRANKLPPPPNHIKGKRWEVRYSSVIAKAQRLNEAQNIARALQILEPLAKFKPDVINLINSERITKKIWSAYGNDFSLLATQLELKKMKAQQAAMAQKALAQQDQLHQSQVNKNQAPMVNALTSAQESQNNSATPQ